MNKKSGKKILIVEDNEMNLKLFTDLLEAHGNDIVHTRDGEFAEAMVEEHMPNLIIMDIQLPHISGIDVIKSLKGKKHLKHIPIIAVTAFAMHDDEKKIMATGCEAYISKPISIQPFLQIVNKFL